MQMVFPFTFFINCVNHPDKTAVGACVYCRKLFCADSLVEVNGKMVCKSDISKALKDKN